jgi:hypothetical protein
MEQQYDQQFQVVFDVSKCRDLHTIPDIMYAELYGVETRVLKQAVKRNIARFPVDFMFELSRAEFDNLRSQIVISSWGGSGKLLLEAEEKPKPKIGFTVKERVKVYGRKRG